jgi:RNA polymerase sigma factor (TIGR02999 family)
MAEARTITLLLRDVAVGDKEALDRLMPLVYGELRRIADGQLRRERQGHTLQPTALVHEAYVRLMRGQQPDYNNRTHFLAIASQVMRKILIDHARTKNASKRGGGRAGLSLDEARDACVERPEIMIALDDALNELERLDPRKARLIEMRYFGGLTAEESAQAVSLGVAEVRRELRVAQAWLQRELDRGAGGRAAS